MRRKLVAGNWKMHGSRHFVTGTLQAMREAVDDLDTVDMAICPSFVHLAAAETALQGSSVALGAQNVYFEQEGAFTGEVSAPMLTDYSVRYVIVGHSERRQLFGDTDSVVAKKFVAVQAVDMVPILCLGESLDERDRGVTAEVILGQLNAVLDVVGIGAFKHAVVAYEPIWAIGTGKTATPEQAQQVHELIRKRLAELDASVAQGCRVLYGGSVKADNARSLFDQPDIDGGLVGGASLKADDFASICKTAS